MESTWVIADGWKVAHLSVPVEPNLVRLACGRRLSPGLEPAGANVDRCRRCLGTERRYELERLRKELATARGNEDDLTEAYIRLGDALDVVRAERDQLRQLNTPKPPKAGARSRGDLAMEANYQRPVKAKLHVHLDSGESWEATKEDLEKFNLVNRHEAYMTFDAAFDRVLRVAGLVEGDITDAQLNPVRYLVETAIAHPHLIDHPEHEGWKDVAEIERILQARAAEPES